MQGFSHRNTSTNNLSKALISSCDPVLRDKPLEAEKYSLFIINTFPGSRQYKNSSLSCIFSATFLTNSDVPENKDRKMIKKSVITDKLPFPLTKHLMTDLIITYRELDIANSGNKADYNFNQYVS